MCLIRWRLVVKWQRLDCLFPDGFWFERVFPRVCCSLKSLNSVPLKHRSYFLCLSQVSATLGTSVIISAIINVEDDSNLQGVFCLPRSCSAKFTLSVWHPCKNRTPPRPWCEQEREPHLPQTIWNVALHQRQSIRSKTASFSLFCLQTASSTTTEKRKQPYYPLALVIVSALFKWKVSAAQPPRYIFYLLYKSPR